MLSLELEMKFICLKIVVFVDNLRDLLTSVSPSKDKGDMWIWKLCSSQVYFVKTTYFSLANSSLNGLDSESLAIFESVLIRFLPSIDK